MRNTIEFDILDGMLGNSAGFASGKIGVIGVSSIVPSSIVGLSDFQRAAELFGDGPLRDFLQGAFSFTKKPIIYSLALTGSTAGTKSSVTADKAVASKGSLTLSGDPRNEYDIQIVIDSTGGLNVATFHFIIETVASKTYTVPANPGTFEIPNTGITVTFVPGSPGEGEVSFTEGDTFTFSTTAPTVTNEELLDAVDDMILASKEKGFTTLVIVGATDSAFWTAYNTRLLTEQGKNHFMLGICEARYLDIANDETIDEYVEALAGDERPAGSLKCIQVLALNCEQVDLNGQTDIRSYLGHYAGWLAAMCKVQERPGKVKLGAVTGLTKIYPLEAEDSHFSDLDDAGYVTPVTYYQKSGIFFSRGRLMTELTSDFKTVPQRRVMDKALSLVYAKQLEYLNNDTNISVKDGSPEGLNQFLADSEMPLKDMKRDGEISGYNFIIPEGQNILTSETVNFTLEIIPKGYISKITGTISYKNPALEVTE